METTEFVTGQYIKNVYLNQYGIFKKVELNCVNHLVAILMDGRCWVLENCKPHDNPTLDIYGNTLIDNSKHMFKLYEPQLNPLEKIIQERRFGITDECVKAHLKATERIKLLNQTIEGASKKKQALEEGVEELNSSFEKLDKPGCLSAMKKLGKVLGLHFYS